MRIRALTFVIALLLAACGGGTDRSKAQLRLVNASGGYASLDLRVDDTLRQGGVSYGNSAGYAEIDPDETETQITSAASPTPLLSFTPSLSKNRYYTVLAYGEAGTLRQVLLDDNQGEPADNRALLRVVNAASGAGTLDVYLTGSNEDLGTAVPVQAGAAYGAVGGWITVNSGTWQLRITAVGNPADVRLDVPAVSLPSRHITTLVITPAGGGLLVNGLLLAQRSSITAAANTQSRVRLAVGTAGGAKGGLTVGAVPIATQQDALTVSDYKLVSAGTPTVTASVGGTAVGVPSKTLVAGRDYTFVLGGAATSGRASWIDDDNKPATDTTRARLRLVNALADQGAVAAMSLGLLPVADGVASGFASTPLAVTASASADLTITATGLAAPVPLDDRNLRAGGVYSVFILGPASGPRTNLVEDR